VTDTRLSACARASGASPPLVFDGVSKSLKGRSVLREVSFEVLPGQCVALLGPNGAGKSTSFSLAMGLRRPSAGTVRIFGGDPRRAEVRRRLGCLPQRADLPEELTVREVLTLVGRMYAGAPGRRRELGEVVETLALAELLPRRCGGLSGGQRQLVALACSLTGGPDLLILDEPSVALDRDSVWLMWQALDGFVADGGSVLFATHLIREAGEHSDAVVILRAGKVATAMSPAAVTDALAVCEISFADGRSALPPQIHDLAREVRRDETRTVIRCADPVPVLAALIAARADLPDLAVGPLTLEQLYDDETGR